MENDVFSYGLPALWITSTVLWIAGMIFVTRKYVKAYKAKQKVDAWIWFFVWCCLVLFIEWPVYFIYQLITKVFDANVGS